MIVILVVAAGFIIVSACMLPRCNYNQEANQRKLHASFVWLIATIILLVLMVATLVSFLLVILLERGDLSYIHSVTIALLDIYIILYAIIFSRIVRGVYIKCCYTRKSKTESLVRTTLVFLYLCVIQCKYMNYVIYSL